ncbi:MAG: Inositol 2-dehydrogenase [bacterium ADurb.Bin478]|nr:MAG: Inositol 2-dehydrogenase [bacterium ADurb.Bin478]
MKTVKFGMIGLGLMGKEFAGCVARWGHLMDFPLQPEIIAVCDAEPALFPWYAEHFPTLRQQTTSYRALLQNPEVEVVYCAVPHHLHEEIYTAALQAGKHLMAEKPFGMDQKANERIMHVVRQHPDCFVRCTSQFPFFPAVQRICAMLEAGRFGRIIEVNAGFQHSSDLDPDKPINWKRQVEKNGEYGCMGDLGLHVCHVPFRAGWRFYNVRAILSDIVSERPDGRGNRVPCRTWDNATLFCEAADADSGDLCFPLTLKMQRIAPGEKNTWSLEILGTRAAARFSTKHPKTLQILEYAGGEQVWQQIDMGYETAFRTHTGSIFEFGFSDAILQMWAAFLYELHHQKPLKKFAGCLTPQEAAFSHVLFTAALESQRERRTVTLY